MSVATFYLDDRPRDSGLKLPDKYIQNFWTAWKAIESGNVRKFSSALDSMHSALQKSGPELHSRYHDICIRQVVVSKHKRVRCYYYMSLLAYAAIHNQKAIVDILIEKKACTWIRTLYCGSPLTQMLVYCLHHGCREMINEKMVALLLESVPREKCLQHNGSSNFDKNVANYVPEKGPKKGTMCSPIEMAIQLQRIDIAKRFVKAGADPICADVELTKQILPLFLEFHEFGTNHYFSWLLHEHIPHDEISTFIDKVLEREEIIFHEYARKMFEKESGRHHVHAPLTCGHAEMISRFLEQFPKTDGEDTLRVKDSAGRTALQIAAANGDLESFTTLLERYTDWVNRPGDDIDIAKALLAAAKANHVKIVDIILRRDDDAFEDDNKLSVLHVEPKTSWHTWKIAVHEGLSCIFETLRHYNQRVTGNDFDEEGNTLGHIAARNGNVNLFKVVFPLERELSTELIARKVSPLNKFEDFSNCSMFWSLILENRKRETPLMVAIDNNHYNILESLQERTIERELRQNAKQNREKIEWKHFWKGCGCKLLVHACSSSSSRALDSVKVLVNITKVTLGFEELTRWTEAAFNGSVKAGNDEIVNYFLQNFPDETSDLKNQALLTASEYGHHRCVRILLKSGADVKATERSQNSDKNNCLMKAIKNNHRETVLTILSDGTLGPLSLSFTRERKCDRVLCGCVNIGEYTEYIQPMTLLITHMPDIAEWVLNKCALSKPPPTQPTDYTDSAIDPSNEIELTIQPGRIELQRGISREDELKEIETETDYVMKDPLVILEPPDESELEAVTITDSTEHVNDSVSTEWNVTKPHPVQTMVDFDREDMLNHNLVQTWIDHKLKDVVPELIIYLVLYLLFLANLTTFSLLLPRPGPWNEYCVTNINTTSVEENDAGLNSTFGGTCRGQSRHLVNFFYFDAAALILTSIIYMLLELGQIISRKHRYLKEIENYIQLVMFISVIIFVFPVGQNSCWCLPGWKWQIGALAVFLAWINLLLLIRYIPWCKVGQRSTMMFNVYATFVYSLYLPIILLVTFAIPAYMIFVGVIPTEGGEAQSILAAFTTPFTTLYRVIFLSAGEIGSENFTSTTFLYEEASIILFLLFIIAIPVLFNNFLIGMAVGETEEERQKANISLTKRKIYYIFEVQNVLYRKIIPACTRLCCKSKKKRITLDWKKVQEFRTKDKAIKDGIKAKTRAKYTKRNVKRLKVLMTQNHNTLTLHNVELEKSLQSLGGEVAEMKNEMAEIKESVESVKDDVQKEMAEIKAILAKHFE